MGYIIYLFSILLAVFICHSCIKDSDTPTQKLSKVLGTDMITILQSTEEVKIAKVLPTRKFESPFELQPSGPTFTLNENQRNDFIHMLLNDHNYQFEAIKKCIFVPDYMILIGSDDEIVILINSSCNQCKFYYLGNETLLSYQPAKERFSKFLMNYSR